jgi:hypothetical protein
VTGDDDQRDLARARVGVAAAGAVVALVEGDGDRVVALGPEARVGDVADQLAQVGVAHGDQVLVLRIADVAAVQAVRRVAVHVVALVRDDVAEGGHVPAAQVGGQRADRDLARPVGGVL